MILSDWIKERRRIHGAATEGPWKQDEEDGVRGVDLYTNAEDEEFEDRWERQDADIRTWDADDATAIVDAHNTLPAALTAIEKVLEVISKIDREHSKAPGDDAYADGMCDAAYMFDTALSEAIEGAIK